MQSMALAELTGSVSVDFNPLKNRPDIAQGGTFFRRILLKTQQFQPISAYSEIGAYGSQ